MNDDEEVALSFCFLGGLPVVMLLTRGARQFKASIRELGRSPTSGRRHSYLALAAAFLLEFPLAGYFGWSVRCKQSVHSYLLAHDLNKHPKATSPIPPEILVHHQLKGSRCCWKGQ